MSSVTLGLYLWEGKVLDVVYSTPLGDALPPLPIVLIFPLFGMPPFFRFCQVRGRQKSKYLEYEIYTVSGSNV